MANEENSISALTVTAAADLGRSLQVAKSTPLKAPGLDAMPFVILRNADGSDRTEFIGETLPPPHRKSGTVKLKDADSFNTYYALHGNGAPVYATLIPARFVAVLNDHTKDKANWRDHRADFAVAHSREWDIWSNHNGNGAAFGSNESFALFLEDNSLDIVQPDSATMLNIALNFRIKADVGFSAANRLQDGYMDFAYQNLVTATGPTATSGATVKVPEQFTIEVPIFDGLNAKKYRIDARFRFRLRDGKLTIWYELVRPHKAIEQAFKDIWDQIVTATGAPILHGTPE